jgi:spore coat protein CotF
MSEFKGTKGKWEVKKGQVLNGVYSSKEPICICYGENKVENALLISKSPEILEILKKLLQMYTQTEKPSTRLILEAKQLIKEATEI